MRISRRDALKTLGALAGTAAAARLLPGCGAEDDTPGAITNMVFLMMENRSYDHYLGSRALLEGMPGDGLAGTMSNRDRDGYVVPIWRSTAEAMCVLDPPHSWDPARVQWDAGENDGFALAYQNAHPTSDGRAPLAYQARADLPVLYALADAYTTCDHWFSALLGPTLPNRMYWHAATSNGARSNDEVLGGAFHGVRSLYHNLDEAGVDWAYYFGDLPILAFLEDVDKTGRLRRFGQFLEEAAAGTLPKVSYIDPSFGANDDHPPHHPLLGEQLIASVYQALATSPQWATSLLVITYDEHGGFFDHVSPPTAPDELTAFGFGQLGFRVPAFVIGPYARQGHVSSVVRNHTSALRHIENHFGVPTLTQRDAAATDLAECIDDRRLAKGAASQPIALPAVEIDESQLPASCQAGGNFSKTASADHDVLVWAEANSRKLGALDRRRYTMDGVYEIADYLDRHGLGRIRRRR